MDANPTYVLQLDLGENGGNVSFATLAELLGWVDKEINLWSWQPGAQVRGNVEQVIAEPRGMLASAKNEIQAAVSKEGNEEFVRQRMAVVQGLLQTVFIARRFPHSSTPLGQFLDRLGRESPTAGVYAAGYLFGDRQKPLEAWNADSQRGVIEAVLFQLRNTDWGVLKNGEAVTASLESLRGEWRSNLEKSKMEHAASLTAVESLRTDVTDLHTKQRTEFDGMLDKSRAAFDSAFKDAAEKLQDLIDTFRSKIALQAPIEYWQRKRRAHRGFAGVLGFFSLVGVAVVGTMLYGEIDKLLGAPDSGQTTGAIPHAPEWRIAVLVLFGTLSVWVLRILVRMFLSQLHLAADASERMTMVNTYLALKEGGNTFADEDLRLILQALFRPTSDGLVKDDALPAGVWEGITHSGTGKAG